MKKSFLHLIIIGIFCVFYSCSNDPQEELAPEIIPSQITERSASFPLGQRLPNPYSLSNMQRAYDELPPATRSSGNIEVKTTHKYIRILPDSAEQITLLEDDYDLTLFTYPLDYQIGESEEHYHDPTIDPDDITWMYTVIEADKTLPSGLRYELLENCFIPDDESDIAYELEKKSFTRLGLSEMLEVSPLTRGLERPEGRVTVWDNVKNEFVGVKGLKVVIHNLVKVGRTYTDDDGYYSAPKKWRTKVHYGFRFKYHEHFKQVSKFGRLTLNVNAGWHSHKGYNKSFSDMNAGSWAWSHIQIGAVDYYQTAVNEGISLPTKGLLIGVYRSPWNGVKDSAIIRDGWSKNAIDDRLWWVTMWAGMSQVIGELLPDITITTYDKNAQDIYTTTNHELAHASHYKEVGRTIWDPYRNYILYCSYNNLGTYGEASTPNSGYCGVGEMWGYFIGYAQHYERYYGRIPADTAYIGGNKWFRPHVFWDIYRDRVLTKGQLFKALTNEVNDLQKLYNKLIELYSEKEELINESFYNHLGIGDPPRMNITLEGPLGVTLGETHTYQVFHNFADSDIRNINLTFTDPSRVVASSRRLSNNSLQLTFISRSDDDYFFPMPVSMTAVITSTRGDEYTKTFQIHCNGKITYMLSGSFQQVTPYAMGEGVTYRFPVLWSSPRLHSVGIIFQGVRPPGIPGADRGYIIDDQSDTSFKVRFKFAGPYKFTVKYYFQGNPNNVYEFDQIVEVLDEPIDLYYWSQNRNMSYYDSHYKDYGTMTGSSFVVWSETSLKRQIKIELTVTTTYRRPGSLGLTQTETEKIILPIEPGEKLSFPYYFISKRVVSGYTATSSTYSYKVMDDKYNPVNQDVIIDPWHRCPYLSPGFDPIYNLAFPWDYSFPAFQRIPLN